MNLFIRIQVVNKYCEHPPSAETHDEKTDHWVR